MARAYTVATVALALSVDTKWVDNILSRFTISGVQQSRQGISRRVSQYGVLELSVVRSLTEKTHIPLGVALDMARTLATTGEWAVGGGLVIQLDRISQSNEVGRRLEYAVESTPLPRRGRPPGKTKRGAA
jgi:hypothetical protein